MSTPPPNWYPDPWDAANYRWWDGVQWTTHTAPRDGGRSPAVAVPASGTQSKHRPARMQNAWSSVADRRGQSAKAPDLSELIDAMHLEPLRNELDEQIEVSGETYHVKGIKRVFREARIPISGQGSTLEALTCALLPEPWNPHDPCAVAVMVGTHHIGYIPADLAEDYSPVLCPIPANGTVITGQARIWAKDDAGMIRARVTVLATTADTI